MERRVGRALRRQHDGLVHGELYFLAQHFCFFINLSQNLKESHDDDISEWEVNENTERERVEEDENGKSAE